SSVARPRGRRSRRASAASSRRYGAAATARSWHSPGGTTGSRFAEASCACRMRHWPPRLAHSLWRGEPDPAPPPGPPGPSPAACHVAGVDRLYRIGGAQAVAALAFGTETVPRVDKIVGPGNIWVATAKRLCYGHVDIDSIAGPSEVVIVADRSAAPDLVAADMLAQAEHDPLAAAVCLTTDRRLAARVAEALAAQLATLPRRAIAARALGAFGAIVVTRSLAEAIEIVNRLAPEHVELAVRDPAAVAAGVRHAGAVFLGQD